MIFLETAVQVHRFFGGRHQCSLLHVKKSFLRSIKDKRADNLKGKERTNEKNVL